MSSLHVFGVSTREGEELIELKDSIHTRTSKCEAGYE